MTEIIRAGIDTGWLDALADSVEGILAECNLPGRIVGGGYGRRHVRLVVVWSCNPLADVGACRRLSAVLRSRYGCGVAGVSADDPRCVLIYAQAKELGVHDA
jgi:hypothetical protein